MEQTDQAMFGIDALTRLMETAVLQWEIDANQRLESRYLEDARVWAVASARGDKSPPPVAPMSINYEVVQTPLGPGVAAGQSSTPVSSIKAESFLPTYRTDIGAIGGPVGSLIVDPPGHVDPEPVRYHCSTLDAAYTSSRYSTPDGRRFFRVVEGFMGMRRYWLEIK